MLRLLYRLILRLYPAEVRRVHGAEMEAMFLHCVRAEEERRTRLLWPLVWMRGLADAVAARRPLPRGGWRSALLRDLQWVVRGVQGRGWSAVLAVSIMAIALASSTLVFASADSLIFNRVPYPEPERLVTVAGRPGLAGMVPAPTFEALRQQTGIFSSVAAHQPAVTFVTGTPHPVLVNTAYVTPGLFETLGVLPQWGRSFVDADGPSIDPTAAIIGAALARERFGTPAAAVGQTLSTTDRTLTIVGVMPPGFRYPDGRVHIWRALDYERLNPTFAVMTLVARLAPAVSMPEAGARLATRLPVLAASGNDTVEIVPRFGAIGEQRDRTLRILLGAALCLLLTACATVASLELAGGLRQARASAVRVALGASRTSLVRIACLEASGLTGVAIAIAWVLARASGPVLTSMLPETLTLGGVNPIDADRRAFWFLMAVGGGVWLLASLPAVIYASRPNVLNVLRSDGPGATVSRAGSWIRRGITTAEIALAVVLLVGGLLYLRTYAALLAVPTGLDPSGVVSLGMTMPPETFAPGEERQLSERLRERLAALPYVLSVAPSLGGAPPGNAYTTQATIQIDDGSEAREPVVVRAYDVAPSFFPTVGLAATHGRLLDDADPPTSVVVSETFARYLWDGATPVGRAFRLSERAPWWTVVGVVPHVRTDLDAPGGPRDAAFVVFRPPAPPPPPRVAAPPAAQPEPVINAPTGMVYRFSTILVRLSEPSRSADVLALARSLDSRALYAVEPLDASYASRHAETRMASAIISSFGGVALLIAVAGVFGVMTVLITSRMREIGIRMALGADQWRVRRMVLRASLQLIVTGVGIGTAAAVALSRVVESQLFGVRATDPLTFAGVAGVVAIAGVLATWHPARRAARVDPVVTLRTE